MTRSLSVRQTSHSSCCALVRREPDRQVGARRTNGSGAALATLMDVILAWFFRHRHVLQLHIVGQAVLICGCALICRIPLRGAPVVSSPKDLPPPTFSVPLWHDANMRLPSLPDDLLAFIASGDWPRGHFSGENLGEAAPFLKDSGIDLRNVSGQPPPWPSPFAFFDHSFFDEKRKLFRGAFMGVTSRFHGSTSNVSSKSAKAPITETMFSSCLTTGQPAPSHALLPGHTVE